MTVLRSAPVFAFGFIFTGLGSIPPSLRRRAEVIQVTVLRSAPVFAFAFIFTGYFFGPLFSSYKQLAPSRCLMRISFTQPSRKSRPASTRPE